MGLGATLLRLGDVSAALIAVAAAISALEVAMRYLFNSPTSWVHVSSTTLCVVAFACAGAYAMVRGQHMRVTVFVDRASPRWQTACRWLGAACGAIYLAGLSWGLWREAVASIWRFDARGWIPEATPGPPHWPLPAIGKGLLLAGALLFLLAVIRDAVLLLREPAR